MKKYKIKDWLYNKYYTDKDVKIATKMVNKRGTVLEHRLAIALKLKRPLTRFEIVHHKNRNKKFNDDQNLKRDMNDRVFRKVLLHNFFFS